MGFSLAPPDAEESGIEEVSGENVEMGRDQGPENDGGGACYPCPEGCAANHVGGPQQRERTLEVSAAAPSRR